MYVPSLTTGALPGSSRAWSLSVAAVTPTQTSLAARCLWNVCLVPCRGDGISVQPCFLICLLLLTRNAAIFCDTLWFISYALLFMQTTKELLKKLFTFLPLILMWEEIGGEVRKGQIHICGACLFPHGWGLVCGFPFLLFPHPLQKCCVVHYMDSDSINTKLRVPSFLTPSIIAAEALHKINIREFCTYG